MRGLLARAAVAAALIVFIATSASWRLESVSAQAPTPTPVPGSPNVIIQIDDDKIVVGDPARITLIAFDNEAVDSMRWQARLADSDNDNSDDADNDEGDNDEGDNEAGIDPNDGQGLIAARGDNDNAYDDNDDDNGNSNDNASLFDNDNVDPNADSGLTSEHEFDCDDQTACANVWTVMTSKPGRYEIVGEAKDQTGLRGRASTEIEVRPSR
jgi:hypothetical protein